jgi:Fe-S cluster assembly ATP-binding protein
LRLLRPAVAVLDEIDSGLDIDALRSVARSVAELAAEGTGILIITHYRRILDHLPPDQVHVMAGGRIVRSAPGMELADLLEAGGYEAVVGRGVAAS